MASEKHRARQTAGRQARTPSHPVSLEIFLTAYDPTDLPGFSIDPLGFERGYLFLADKILPGLTNVANRARYFSVLCAGCYLADVRDGMSERETIALRREAILRFERLWALGSALAGKHESEEWSSGLRGISYVNAEVERLEVAGERHAFRDYKLLSRQAPYGALGMYGANAEAMRLWDRRTLTLAPDSGEILARAFIDGTDVPPAVRAAVNGKEVPVKLDALEKWGAKAGPNAPAHSDESAILLERLRGDGVRARMCKLIARHPTAEGASELAWLQALANACAGRAGDADLADAMAIIVAYERCYQLASLVFQRLLWLTHTAPTGRLRTQDRASDQVLQSCGGELPRAVARLRSVLENVQTPHVGPAPGQLDDVLLFLRRATDAHGAVALGDVCVRRHEEIQSGKFDQGRPKVAWLERDQGDLFLAPTRVTLPTGEPGQPDDVRPHPYRLDAATNLIQAAGGLV